MLVATTFYYNVCEELQTEINYLCKSTCMDMPEGVTVSLLPEFRQMCDCQKKWSGNCSPAPFCFIVRGGIFE